jgi:hypothetical protein
VESSLPGLASHYRRFGVSLPVNDIRPPNHWCSSGHFWTPRPKRPLHWGGGVFSAILQRKSSSTKGRARTSRWQTGKTLYSELKDELTHTLKAIEVFGREVQNGNSKEQPEIVMTKSTLLTIAVLGFIASIYAASPSPKAPGHHHRTHHKKSTVPRASRSPSPTSKALPGASPSPSATPKAFLTEPLPA